MAPSAHAFKTAAPAVRSIHYNARASLPSRHVADPMMRPTLLFLATLVTMLQCPALGGPRPQQRPSGHRTSGCERVHRQRLQPDHRSYTGGHLRDGAQHASLGLDTGLVMRPQGVLRRHGAELPAQQHSGRRLPGIGPDDDEPALSGSLGVSGCRPYLVPYGDTLTVAVRVRMEYDGVRMQRQGMPHGHVPEAAGDARERLQPRDMATLPAGLYRSRQYREPPASRGKWLARHVQHEPQLGARYGLLSATTSAATQLDGVRW